MEYSVQSATWARKPLLTIPRLFGVCCYRWQIRYKRHHGPRPGGTGKRGGQQAREPSLQAPETKGFGALEGVPQGWHSRDRLRQRGKRMARRQRAGLTDLAGPV